MIYIEEMKVTDVSAVTELESIVFPDAWSRKSIENTLQQKQSFILVAKYLGEVIGYCILYYAFDQGEIARIAVHPRHQKAGVGCRLFSEMQKQCLERGIEQLFLEVRESNQAAISLYKKFGFTENGIRKHFYTDPPDHAVLMSNDSR